MKGKLFSIKARAICSLVAILVTLALAIPAQAQFDPGLHDVFQTNRLGETVKVGAIFVPRREIGTTNYVEHWVLFDNYVYPSPENLAVTTITASRVSYQSEEEFFARVAWGPGFRYVRVDCLYTDKLPGLTERKSPPGQVQKKRVN